MFTRVILVSILSALCATSVASAQADPADPGYYRTWADSQLDAWGGVSRVEFREITRRKLDNPFGVSTAEVESKVTGFPDDREFERELLSASINGRRVPARRLQEFEERWSRFGGEIGRSGNAFSGWRLRALSALRPSTNPVRDDYNGSPAYRVDLIPGDRPANIDRVTLWFDPRNGRLVASRTILEPQGQRSSLAVEVVYARLQDLDVPVHRTIEGTVQTRRRLRHFTTLVTLESRLEDYRFVSS